MNRPDDPKLGEILISRTELTAKRTTDQQCGRTVALIRVPSDEGVRRNGGRVGAADGPSVVMDLLPRFGCLKNREWNVDLQAAGIQLVDYGQTESGPLEQVHTTLHQMVLKALHEGLTPLSIGGGNDQSAANGRAWIEYWRGRRESTEGTDEYPSGLQRGKQSRLVVINVDAHLDVRPLIPDPTDPESSGLAHSGSPFRQLIEFARGVEDLVLIEFAAQGQQCSSAHVDYVLQNGGQIIWLSELGDVPQTRNFRLNPPTASKHLRKILEQCLRDGSRVFFSFDLDAIRDSDCPGVSCPSPMGLTSLEALSLCYEAGKCAAVDLMDISEFNPRVESSQTSRLLVNMIYHFLLGYAERKDIPVFC